MANGEFRAKMHSCETIKRTATDLLVNVHQYTVGDDLKETHTCTVCCRSRAVCTAYSKTPVFKTIKILLNFHPIIFTKHLCKYKKYNNTRNKRLEWHCLCREIVSFREIWESSRLTFYICYIHFYRICFQQSETNKLRLGQVIWDGCIVTVGQPINPFKYHLVLD